MLKRLALLFLGLALGIIPAIWIIQNNRHVKKLALKPILQQLEENWNATISIKKMHVNLFTGLIYLDHFTIKSKHKVGCTWVCKHGILHIMQQKSLYDKRVNLHFELNDNTITTEYRDQTLGVAELLKAIFTFQSKHFNAQSFLINGLNLRTGPKATDPLLTYRGSLFFKRDNSNLWHGRLISKKSSIKINNKNCITNLSGSTRFHQLPAPVSALQAKFAYTFRSPSLQNETYSLAGTWGQKQPFILKNERETINLSFLPYQKGLQINFDISHSSGIAAGGTAVVDLEKKTISGTTPYADYLATFDFGQEFPVTKILFIKNKKIVAKFVPSKEKIVGLIAYRFLQSHLPIHLRKWVLGNKGVIKLEVVLNDLARPTGKISFLGGKLHIPGNYNLITDLHANFICEPQAKKLLIDDMMLDLHKGSVTCSRATIYWNDQYEPTFLHAHVHVNDFLLNWKNDIFAFINGNFLVTKPSLATSIKIFGDVIITKSLFKEGIFSGKASANIMQSSILPLTPPNQSVYFDFSIANEQDLSIKTPFLQTKATADVRVTCHTVPDGLSTPQIRGNIALHQGTLTFPKHKLFISSGKIDFIPTQINNPMVNLLAKNRIKKYLVSLQVAGPFQQPTIFLESNPPLTEEQIIALLFAGSETINLQANLPVILMQNLHKLIFGDKQELPPAQRFFKKITAPLKYIQVTPDFTDQSGRGGVKGTISIDVNKRLHGLIQKNFTMQDDLAFQIEYFLSDDFNIKAIKDAREDIGVELELVYKK